MGLQVWHKEDFITELDVSSTRFTSPCQLFHPQAQFHTFACSLFRHSGSSWLTPPGPAQSKVPKSNWTDLHFSGMASTFGQLLSWRHFCCSIWCLQLFCTGVDVGFLFPKVPLPCERQILMRILAQGSSIST